MVAAKVAKTQAADRDTTENVVAPLGWGIGTAVKKPAVGLSVETRGADVLFAPVGDGD